MSAKPSPLPLTVVIPTYNEADNLPTLLPQLSWAAEILVVDSLSTDGTQVIARAAGATVLERPLDTIGQQKNWGMAQAQHPWVLLIDADERLTPESIQEVQRAVLETASSPFVAYRLWRQNHFMGRPMRHGGLERDRVIRLVQKAHCAYDHKQVHERMQVDGRIGQLIHPLQHYTYRNLSFFLEKQQRYAQWSAQDYAAKVRRVTLGHLLLKPLGRFVIQYGIKRGFMDGKAGLVYCAISAWTVFLRYAYLMQQHHDSEGE